MSTRGFRKRLARPLVVVPALAILVTGAGIWVRSSEASTPATSTVERTAAVTVGTMAQTVVASGTLEPTETKNLDFTVSGHQRRQRGCGPARHQRHGPGHRRLGAP